MLSIFRPPNTRSAVKVRFPENHTSTGHVISAVRSSTTEVLVVAEALHAHAVQDVCELLGQIVDQLIHGFGAVTTQAVLSEDAPRFSFGSP